jgi:hypothetical protein
MTEKFAFIWPPPPDNTAFQFGGDSFSYQPPVPTQPPGEWICPHKGCIGAQFTYLHGAAPMIQCETCKGGFAYDHTKIHELIRLNTPDIKYKYCPNPCCGHPTRQPKYAMEHPSMQHFSMGTYCRGCGAMWTRKEYIDEPKPKPWVAPTPAASAPPLVDEPALQHVQPTLYVHGVKPEKIEGGRELGTLHNILHVLISIESLLRRQEGVLQTVVGQRLARIEDTLSNVEGNSGEIVDAINGSLYNSDFAGSYEGSFRVYNENA